MASERLAFKQQPASQEPPSSETPEGDTLVENLSGKPAEEPAENGVPAVNPDCLPVITDEVLRHRVRMLLDEKPRPSTAQSLFSHPLLIVVVGFALTGLVGGYLTNNYSLHQKSLEHQRSLQQQELARQQSFSDELNKIRIQKIGVVWELIDKNEVALDGLLNKANRASGSNKEDFAQISKIIDEDIAFINANRFWLGEKVYNKLKDYLDITGRYVFDMLLGQPGIDLSETARKREQAKQDVLNVRIMFLKGEPEL
jgi:hypothetical protein